MSKTASRMQQMRFIDVASKVLNPGQASAAGHDAPLITAARTLAGQGIYGLIWLDSDLRVASRYGSLVGFAEIGEEATTIIPALVGLEAEILALAETGTGLIDLPAVGIVSAEGPPAKLNFKVTWLSGEQQYLVLVSKAAFQSSIEIELSRQHRARLIAEAELKHKSEQLAQANTELARANRDLEEFASIISHDLKSPMRALRYLAQDVAKDEAVRTIPDMADRLQKLEAQTERMGEMLSSLLDYSIAGRKEEVIEPVDTAELVDEIVTSLARSDDFTVQRTGSWPVIETARAPLDIVLRNLIGNAIQHHDRAHGCVDVTMADEADAFRFAVKDDGPGIAPRLHAAAFLPFRQLGNGGGHGMGLAFVKRWVEASGGEIGIVSDAPAQRGTIIWFTWPKKFAG